MTEDEWNRCTDPQQMVAFLRDTGRASDRNLRASWGPRNALAGLLACLMARPDLLQPGVSPGAQF
jgi:hypothetical protein